MSVPDTFVPAMPEEILEPDLPICDPHHHLFDRPDYPCYLLPELLADVGSGHRIESTIFVDAGAFYSKVRGEDMAPVGEVEFAAGVAAMSESGTYGTAHVCEGIVGFANLRLGEVVQAVLEAEIAAAGGRLRGIRQIAAFDPAFQVASRADTPLGLYTDVAFQAGFAMLERYGLVFDACVFHPQIGDVIALARAFPNIPIVLDHMGMPIATGPYAGRLVEEFADWRRDIRALAEHGNVFVKLGGLGMTRFRGVARDRSVEGLADAWRPFIETSIEAFGPERAMFESNFPIDRDTCSYARIWNVFKRLSSGCSDEEKRLLFRNSARRFYRLDADRTGRT